MIKDAGIEEVNGKRHYKFFSGQMFDLKIRCERLVEEYFHPAAKRLDVRNVFYFNGSSDGKSTLVTYVKKRA